MLPAKEKIYQHTLIPGVGTGWIEPEAVEKKVIAWTVVSTAVSSPEPSDNPYWGDPGDVVETLQVVAPVGLFAIPAGAKWRPVVWANGRPWTMVGTELLAENNPFWAPGLAVTVWRHDSDETYPEFIFPEGVEPPGVPDPEPEPDPTPDPGDGFDPEQAPESYKYNPYDDAGNPLNGQGTGPYGTVPPANSDYNPYADEHSPYYNQGGGAYGNDWPEGESSADWNAYWQYIFG